DEGDVAAALPLRLRLADVVQQRAEAQRLAAGQLIGQRLVEELGRLGRQSAEEAGQVCLDREPLLEHGQGVAMDVEVVVGVLHDAAQRVELGQHGSGQVERVEQLDPPQ